jgi:sortase A
MRRAVRIVANLLLLAGVLGIAWVITVWRWQDPFTALYTHYEQGKLASSLSHQIAVYRAPRQQQSASVSVAEEEHVVAAEAAAYRRQATTGQAIGRIEVPRMGLNIVVVNGTDESSLEKGPGRYLGSAMPGQGQLVYIAGHRTTFLAPFSNIDQLRKGDSITLEMPYATFVYRVTGHRIVPATDLAVLKSPGHELLELQACHPRFFATHRYIAYALPVKVIPRDGRAYRPRS